MPQKLCPDCDTWVTFLPRADVAQLVEHWLPKPRVAGSIPVVRSSKETPGACSVDTMDITLAQLKEAGDRFLPGFFGIEIDGVEDGVVRGHLSIRKQHLAPNGYLHSAAVVALADTACGYGCILSLPEGGTGFTTIELKTNFLRTALEGTIACEARLVHGGRTTQLWDATVTDPSGRPMALFRCTQLVLRGT
jgi:1,4-dihydroxy-2-naphthoyl-CoA hydrolase